MLIQNRNTKYALILAVTIFFGLGSRMYRGPLDHWVHLYIGDVLYTTMFYFLARWFWRNISPEKAAIGAILLCYAIETLQLYHAPWIEAIRANRLGILILGSGFLWSDFVCYTLGGILGVVVEKAIRTT